MPEVEATVEEIMQLMEPSYLEENSPSAENMRRLLFAAAVVVGDSHGSISMEERQALVDLLGHDAVPFTLDPERLAEVLPERIESVKTSVPMGRRVLLVRDLTLIARADGHIQPDEIKVIEQIASDLGVSPEIAWVTFESPTELD
ncbi:TPA: TerB family tellurite resistance protein [Candidatus Poribacteria bacterium]|nr:TerB family tellurite resistance protein [Candidatus Poribacteria bacterium]